uniref:Capsid protein n=1 Tax=Giant panda circovirus 5 TaxID=2863957 RepID=A0A8K1HJ79_9CIRC|nr:capsid protein [Giant panda circovirus 5]
MRVHRIYYSYKRPIKMPRPKLNAKAAAYQKASTYNLNPRRRGAYTKFGPRYARTAPIKRNFRSKFTNRKKRYVKRKGFSKSIPAARTNFQTLITDHNDVATVVASPAALSTAGSVDTTGKQCKWFFVGSSSDAGLHQGMLLGLADTVQLATLLVQQQSPTSTIYANETKISIIDCYQTSELVNASNGIANLTSYKVMCRRDVAFNGANNYSNLYNLIGQGFFQRGFGSTGYGANEGLTDAELSLYDSHKFCSEFKIVQSKKTALDPGTSCKFSVSARSKIINYNHYTTESAHTTLPSAAGLDYCHREGEMFWIHKLEGIPAADTNTPVADATYTLPRIRMITKTHYNFCQINPGAPLITKIAAHGYQSTAGGNVVMEQDESGAQAVSYNV